MTETDHGAVARKFFDALHANDLVGLITVMHPELVWEIPGRSPVAGRHVGLEAVGAMLLDISSMAAGTEVVTAGEIFVNDTGAVALVDVFLTAPGDEPWHGEDAWLVRTDGGRVTHVREHWFETRGFDHAHRVQRARRLTARHRDPPEPRYDRGMPRRPGLSELRGNIAKARFFRVYTDHAPRRPRPGGDGGARAARTGQGEGLAEQQDPRARRPHQAAGTARAGVRQRLVPGDRRCEHRAHRRRDPLLRDADRPHPRRHPRRRLDGRRNRARLRPRQARDRARSLLGLGEGPGDRRRRRG